MIKNSFKYLSSLLIFLLALALFVQETFAFEASKLGVHILSLDEAPQAKELLSLENQESSWNYVTVPLTLDDLKRKQAWQEFFNVAKEQRLIPIVRLTTRFNPDLGAWEVPTKKDIVDQVEFLSSLTWPTQEKYIIIFNEVNHAKEWGGKINPQQYAQILRFAADWAHTEKANYIVLPAGLDLAAPNSYQTREAFTYLKQMLAFDPDIFEVVDVWNSHSYPNPGFSSSPTRFAKNSLRGYQYELRYLKKVTGREFKVMITETGWDANPRLSKWLGWYYSYAMEHIWSDKRILAVTPFVLKGSPGPFAGFSFFDENNQPTAQYYALKSGLEKVTQTKTDHKLGLKN